MHKIQRKGGTWNKPLDFGGNQDHVSLGCGSVENDIPFHCNILCDYGHTAMSWTILDRGSSSSFFFSGLHHYECIAHWLPTASRVVGSGPGRLRRSMTAHGSRGRSVHPGHPRSSWWSLPIHRRRGSQALLSVYIVVHSADMPE